MSNPELFKDVPEFVEGAIGESLVARSDALAGFRELGPPDLVHVIKTGRQGSKDVGSYHYVSGVDVSSSASVAAYFYSLTNSIDAPSTWLGGKSRPDIHITRGCFAAFNAFSRSDVRVEVKMPGGVDAYAIDARGDRYAMDARLWQETYVSAMARSILYADDATFRLAGYRKLPPFRSAEDEQRFLSDTEACFHKGWLLGSDPEIQVATNINNHLACAVMKYFGDAYRLQPAVNLFEKLLVREGEVAGLLAKAYIGMNEEVKAVQVLHRAMHDFPQSYSLLHVQADFLRTKAKSDWAQKLARTAVNCAPSEFITWAKLTEINIEVRDFDQALLTLNSCPMFTFNERDLHRMPPPVVPHLPMHSFIIDSGVLEPLNEANSAGTAEEENYADPTLLALPAPNLKGTFREAYNLLTKLVAEIGWDELLRARSQVFVMEEEYRQAKADGGVASDEDIPLKRSTTSQNAPTVNGTGATSTPGQQSNDDAASTTAILSQSADQSGLQQASKTDAEDQRASAPSSPVPEIKVSSSSIEEDPARKADADKAEEASEVPKSDFQSDAEGLEKPTTAVHHQQTAAAPTGIGGDEPDTATTVPSPGGANAQAGPAADGSASNLSFSSKRLCERWLDNLFMVLYEDLRVMTVWKAEMAHFKHQQMPYRKSATEWEILGDLALRLHRKEEAKEAYQRSLDAKFSAKAWLELLKMYVEERDIPRALNASVRLATYNHRWYQDCAYPSAVGHELFKLIKQEGSSKVYHSLLSMRLSDRILDLMQTYFTYARTFRVEGSEQ